MDNRQFIINKLDQLKVIADNEEDPVFIVTAKLLGQKGKNYNVQFKGLFFSDNEKPMDKAQRSAILKYLDKFVKDEKKML
jgi:hypothetical protein